MPYKSNLTAVTRDLKQARTAGLQASAEVYQQHVANELRGGFTSGDFATGDLADSVEVSEVQTTEKGAAIKVGTSVFYAAQWELGFISAFTRQFERKEVWMPALDTTREPQMAAFRSASGLK
jgi:hypothetical protein